MGHPLRDLRDFLGDDDVSGFIYARRKDDHSIFFLPDGEGAERRSFVKAELECLIPGCPAPALTSAHRAKKRDGFAHMPGSNVHHAAADVHHVQAQLGILRWLAKVHPEPKYTSRMEWQTNAQRERIADVMVRREVDQFRVAFEVQYASMSPDEWQARHDSYLAQSIPDIWVFGHVRAQMPRVRGGEGLVQLAPLHERVAESGSPVLWINPESQEIAIAVTTATVGEQSFEVLGAKGQVHLIVEPLAVFMLSAGGILNSPTLWRLRKAAKKLGAAQEIEIARLAAEELRMAEAAAELADRNASEELARAHRAATTAKRNEALQLSWRESDDFRALAAALGGEIPDWIVRGTTSMNGVDVAAQQWQARLYLDLVHRQPEGTSVTLTGCLGALRLSTSSALMVRLWLDRLVSRHVLVQDGPASQSRYRTPGRRIDDDANVIASSSDSGGGRCRLCGWVLDERYLAIGQHELCQSVNERLRARLW